VNLTEIEARDEEKDEGYQPCAPDCESPGCAAMIDRRHLLALVREQAVKLGAVEALADRWATVTYSRDRYYARDVRAALDATEGA
jgi:hypothetical protein